MRRLRYGLAFLSAVAVSTTVADLTGCAAGTNPATCTVTPFISPTAVTLDHTTGASQVFTTGNRYSGPCAQSAIAILYTWNVSDTVDATVSSTGAVSCINASLAPITVYSSVIGYSGTPPVAMNMPTNLPTATLTCK